MSSSQTTFSDPNLEKLTEDWTTLSGLLNELVGPNPYQPPVILAVETTPPVSPSLQAQLTRCDTTTPPIMLMTECFVLLEAVCLAIQSLVGTVQLSQSGVLSCTEFEIRSPVEELIVLRCCATLLRLRQSTLVQMLRASSQEQGLEDEWSALGLLDQLCVHLPEGSVRRIKLQLSADSPFPYELGYFLAQPEFRVLSLDTFRGELPLQFWRICGHFTVKEGKARWHYRVLGAPHLLSESNAQHLKALCHRAQAEPEIAKHVELLFLWEQGLNRLPSNIGALTALRRIEMWNNPLPGIPESISKCTALEELVLGEDQRHLETSLQQKCGWAKLIWTTD